MNEQNKHFSNKFFISICPKLITQNLIIFSHIVVSFILVFFPKWQLAEGYVVFLPLFLPGESFNKWRFIYFIPFFLKQALLYIDDSRFEQKQESIYCLEIYLVRLVILSFIDTQFSLLNC